MLKVVTVELLYFDGCPNYAQYLPRLQALLADAGLDAEVALRRIESEEAAVAARFLGSPTVRINGEDVEPNADRRTQYGLQCRLYHTASGWAGYPPDEWVRDSLSRHSAEVQ
jgi:hypothetical protein